MRAGLKVLLPATLALGFALGFALGQDSSSEGEREADHVLLLRLERGQEEVQRALRELAARECYRERVREPASSASVATRPVGGGPTAEVGMASPAPAPAVSLSPSLPAASTPPPVPAPMETSRESLAARDECMRLIDSAVRAREWGDREAERLQALLEELTEDQRAEVLERLVDVLNAGDVRITTDGVPF